MKRLIPLLIAAPLATSVSAQRPMASLPPPTLPTSAPRPPVEVSLDWYAVGKPVKPTKPTGGK